MTDGRRKGQSYMLEVCALLGRWARKPYGTFQPRPTLVEPQDGWTVKGDISFPSSIGFPFVVECKKIEGWSLDALAEGRAKDIYSWWVQCPRQAAATPGAWRNARPPLTASRDRRRNDFAGRGSALGWGGLQAAAPCLSLSLGGDRVMIGHLEDLISTTTPGSRETRP